jgi:hypothetical protein
VWCVEDGYEHYELKPFYTLDKLFYDLQLGPIDIVFPWMIYDSAVFDEFNASDLPVRELWVFRGGLYLFQSIAFTTNAEGSTQ